MKASHCVLATQAKTDRIRGHREVMKYTNYSRKTAERMTGPGGRLVTRTGAYGRSGRARRR